jgi:TPR repeat protein
MSEALENAGFLCKTRRQGEATDKRQATMAASSSMTMTAKSLRAIVLALALAFVHPAPAQESGFRQAVLDLIDPDRSLPSGLELLERRAFLALNAFSGRRQASTALPLLNEAAERGSAAAMAQLGLMYREGQGVTRDVVEAARLMRLAAERGSSMGQLYLGGMYLEGEGVAADPVQARAWMEAAANQDDPVALFTLAQMYISGMGVEVDTATGFELLSRSAALGDSNALRTLGLELLRNPDRLDPARAVAMLERAAEGDPRTAYELGYQYLIGSLLAEDVARGAQWIRTAANRGYPQAQLILADMLELGIGAERDPERAQRSRAELMAELSPDDQNGLAWRYSVSPDDTLRNGLLAVEIMERLLASADMVNPARLDTLAAAYAEAGRFEDAIRMQQAAIDRALAERGSPSPSFLVSEGLLAELRARIEGYRAGEPYRAPF